MLDLSVSNFGGDITPETLGRVFELFSRSDFACYKQGLGLCL